MYSSQVLFRDPWYQLIDVCILASPITSLVLVLPKSSDLGWTWASHLRRHCWSEYDTIESRGIWAFCKALPRLHRSTLSSPIATEYDKSILTFCYRHRSPPPLFLCLTLVSTNWIGFQFRSQWLIKPNILCYACFFKWVKTGFSFIFST